MKRIVSLFLIICLTLSIPTIAYATEQTLPDNSEISQYGNLSGNILNGGFAVEYDGWVYYANYEDNGYLYRKKGHSNEKVLNEVCKYINVYKNLLCYACNDEYHSYIKTYNPQTGDEKILLSTEEKDSLYNVVVKSDKLYYLNSNDQNIYVYDIKSEESYLLESNEIILDFIIIDSNSYIYRILEKNENIEENYSKTPIYIRENGKSKKIADSVDNYDFDAENYSVYYSSLMNKSSYGYDIANKKAELITYKYFDNLIYYNQKVYFVDRDDLSNTVFEYNTMTEEFSQTDCSNIFRMNIIQDEIVYEKNNNNITLFDNSTLTKKLQEIKSLYGYRPRLDYYTTDNVSCQNHSRGTDKGYIYGSVRAWQCAGFAADVFSRLHGVQIAAWDDGKNMIDYSVPYKINNSRQVTLINQINPGSVNNNSVKAMFDMAELGDFLQISYNKGSQHSMIFEQKNSNDISITVYEGNTSNNCDINERPMTYSCMVEKYKGMSLYRPTSSIPAKPTNTNLTINKGNNGVYYNEDVTFNFSATNATKYNLIIERDGVKRFDLDLGAKTSHVQKFGIGDYSAYIRASNSSGSVNSSRVNFKVINNDFIPVKVKVDGNKVYSIYDCGASWTKSKNLAEKMGGHLASVESQKEQDLINELIMQGVEGIYWLGGEKVNGQWQWVDGKPWSYEYWAPGDPTNLIVEDQPENCLRLPKSKMMWEDGIKVYYDVSWHGFVLKTEINNQPEATKTINGKTYMLFDNNMNWYEAQAYSESLGGRLATIHNQEEQNAVSELMENGTKDLYLVGATDKDQENVWKWVDGSAMTYSNWNAEQPDNSNGAENYLSIYRSSTKWNDIQNYTDAYDYTDGRGFICEIPNYVSVDSQHVTKSGNSYNIELTVKNNFSNELNCIGLFSAKSDSGKLLNAVSENINIGPFASQKISAAISCSEPVSYVDFSMIKSYDSFKPLSESMQMHIDDTTGLNPEESGTPRILSGQNAVFANKQVLLFVHKGDSITDDSIEYVGQQKAGGDGSYSFNYITKEEPTGMTGEFKVYVGCESLNIPERGANIPVEQESMLLTVSDADGKTGSEVEVTVSLKGNTGISSFSMALKYDKSKLEPVAVSKGSILKTGSIASNLSDYEDKSAMPYVTAVLMNASDFNDDGELLKFRFKIKDSFTDGDTQVSIMAEKLELRDQNHSMISAGTAPGKVTAKPYLTGDIYTDDVVDIKDAIRLAQYLAEWRITLTANELSAADVYADGKVDVDDLLMMAQYLARWPGVHLGTVSAKPSLLSNEYTEGISLTFDSLPVNPGETGSMTVSVDGNPGIAGFTFDMTLDLNKIDVIAVAGGDVTHNGTIESNFNKMTEDGILSVYYNGIGDTKENGSLFTVTYRIKENVTDSLIDVAAGYKFSNQKLEEIYPKIVGSNSIKVKQGGLSIADVRKNISEQNGRLKGSISVDVLNDSGKSFSASAVVAVYDGEGRLIDAFIKNAELKSDTTTVELSNIDVSGSGSEMLMFKVMILNKNDLTKPLTKSYTGKLK